MKTKQRLFIFDRKEISVLFLLTLMVALFSFTFGVHLGKRIHIRTKGTSSGEGSKVSSRPDEMPSRQELLERGDAAQQASETLLDQELQEEVARTGIKLEQGFPVELPKKPVSENGGATTLHPNPGSSSVKSEKAPPATPRPETKSRNPANKKSLASQEKYTLQIGSYPTLNEAKKKILILEHLTLKPYLHEAEVRDKGKWYRLYLGEYPTRGIAELAGEKYRSQHQIDQYIVTKLID